MEIITSYIQLLERNRHRGWVMSKKIRAIFIIILIFLAAIIMVNKDTNRHLVYGIITQKYVQDNDFRFIVTHCDHDISIHEVPEIVYNFYNINDRVFFMIRGNQFRYASPWM